jgi:hypothetical protein
MKSLESMKINPFTSSSVLGGWRKKPSPVGTTENRRGLKRMFADSGTAAPGCGEGFSAQLYKTLMFSNIWMVILWCVLGPLSQFPIVFGILTPENI